MAGHLRYERTFLGIAAIRLADAYLVLLDPLSSTLPICPT
jgi:hypothetical protein